MLKLTLNSVGPVSFMSAETRLEDLLSYDCRSGYYTWDWYPIDYIYIHTYMIRILVRLAVR